MLSPYNDKKAQISKSVKYIGNTLWLVREKIKKIHGRNVLKNLEISKIKENICFIKSKHIIIKLH